MLNIHHVLLVTTDSLFPRVYFTLYALGETLFEVTALALLSQLIKRYFKRWIYKTFIALSMLFIVVHIVDFVLVRIMGMTVWFALGMVFDGTYENFIEMIHIVEFDLSVCLLAILALVMIPLSGLILYNLSHKVSKKRPFIIKHSLLFRLICVVPIALIALDVTIAHYVTGEHFLRFANALPFKSTLLTRKMDLLQLKSPLQHSDSEDVAMDKLAAIPLPVTKKPNIFLFVTESLRGDFLTAEVSPTLNKFAKENFSHPRSFSNANATQLSWYAITHGKYAYNWSNVQRRGWSVGGIPLQAFKKMGYKISVYSGSQLRYYNLDTLMFGKNRGLVDSFNQYPQYAPHEIWEGDEKAASHLIDDLGKKEMQEGNLCLIFFDSTHFNYSWPKEQKDVFTPALDKVNYMSLSRSTGQIEGLKNRYRNSIRYVDTLFEKIVNKIESLKKSDEMAIVFTGDHGEEFYEKGQLYHASHLSPMQTEVPIYYRLGNKSVNESHATTSHIDIMPTLLHYVAGDERFGSLCDGKSLLSDHGKGFEICARYNGGKTPYEFFVTDGAETLTLRFADRNIFRGKILKVVSSTNNRKAFKPYLMQLFDLEEDVCTR
ncbi:MAG: sulfatase-like hydrolase/transferase [Simkaniaceae bacterium]|nr:sulfatase-like hydrolase/transferase [Simkaniaceae bacterium]